jgi:sugar phosphate isomerase/epimerase
MSAPLRIAVAARCFRLPLPDLLPAVAASGAGGIQFDVRNELRPADLSSTGRRQFLHRLNELGLSLAALEFPVRRAFYDEDQLEARVAAAKSALEFAWQLQAKVVTTRIGSVPADDAPEFAVLCDVLNDLARHSNRVGATLAITPSRDAPEALARLLAQISDGPIGLNFDPAVLVMSGHAPAEAFRSLHRSILHVTVRDAVHDMDGGGREVPVGRGEVAWDELLALCTEADYRGWLTVDRTAGEDPRGDATRAISYLRRVAMS